MSLAVQADEKSGGRPQAGTRWVAATRAAGEGDRAALAETGGG